MEINRSSIGKSEEQMIIWSSSTSSSEEQQHSSSINVRLYTCSFCKKGFSNAQALGGHMNIHRRDRARLREAIDDDNLLSLNISNPNLAEDKSLHLAESSELEEISCIPNKTPYSLCIDNDFDDTKTDTSTNKEDATMGNFPYDDEDMKRPVVIGGDRSRQIEVLDLELRLGSEPVEMSQRRTSSSTIEFF